ncbi:hypothetical protein FACS1894133_5730 [Clostridia bacterium]|nr:hypothetical protein FACS1894133_5730 [Clostridia bacterium]
MRGVSQAQVTRAKEINIEEYILQNESDNVKRIGKAYYLKDHDSLEISNGLWNWHSQGVGGKNVIDYLIKVRGFGFIDAVRHLAEDEITVARHTTPTARPPTAYKQFERAPFKLPPRNSDNKRVIAYLEQRGIDRDIIQDCIKCGLLYESATWHNCVFVGLDENGKSKFAALRGTNSDFKRDALGSDKRFSFSLPPVNPYSNTVFVFESPIDLLSYDTLCKLGNIAPCDGWRLSLGGTSMLALQNLIEREKFRNPIANCVVCTDRDAAGHLAFSEISEKLTIKVSREIPVGKDWNETLQKIRNEVNPMETENLLKDKRKSIRFISSDYDTLFTVKDGDSVKFISGYDGEVQNLKCRVIDETHIRLTGKHSDDYHICQLAEISEKNGNKFEPLPDQQPKLNILAAKYGETLQDVEIPMTDAAIKNLVGDNHTTEVLRGEHVLLRGKDGVAVCKNEGGVLTTVHPYWAQTLKREIGVIEAPPPEKTDFLGKIDKFKTKAAEQILNAASPDKLRESAAL